MFLAISLTQKGITAGGGESAESANAACLEFSDEQERLIVCLFSKRAGRMQNRVTQRRQRVSSVISYYSLQAFQTELFVQMVAGFANAVGDGNQQVPGIQDGGLRGNPSTGNRPSGNCTQESCSG